MFGVSAAERSGLYAQRQTRLQSGPLRRRLRTQALPGAGQFASLKSLKILSNYNFCLKYREDTEFSLSVFLSFASKSMHFFHDPQLLDRDDSHSDNPESVNAKSPLHLAVSF